MGCQSLSEKELRRRLRPDVELVVFDEIDSTNLEAKRRVSKGETQNALIVADSQTLGRGRFGRSFYSPAGCGIYMSLLFTLGEGRADDATLLTTAAAVAVCRAIEKADGGVSPLIKWVNDIYVNEKKACGILAEAVADPKSGEIVYFVIGIGINFKESGAPLPDEIADIAGTVFGKSPPVSREWLISQTANELLKLLPELSNRGFLDEYRSRSMLLGREIVYAIGDERHFAVAEAVGDGGELIVSFPDGRREALHSGEVSARAAGRAAELPRPVEDAAPSRTEQQ